LKQSKTDGLEFDAPCTASVFALQQAAEGGSTAHRVSVAVLDLHAYLNRLASALPTPGGGSAATIVGALGAALVAMVARITLGSAKHADVHADALLLVGEADALRAQFASARTADEEAYGDVPQAQALPRTTDEERSARNERLQAALAVAAEAPLRAAALASELLGLCERAAALRNAHLVSDVECALLFGHAALEASAANVRINHRYLTDEKLVDEQSTRLAATLRTAHRHEAAAGALIASE
jgi:formiminotetrahydrofolate cyclodeaminase